MAPSGGGILSWCFGRRDSDVGNRESSQTTKANGVAENMIQGLGPASSSSESPNLSAGAGGASAHTKVLKWGSSSVPEPANAILGAKGKGTRRGAKVLPELSNAPALPPGIVEERSSGNVDGRGRRQQRVTDLVTPMDSFGEATGQHAGQHQSTSTTGRHFSGVELRELGFQVFSNENMAKELPTSSTQPVAILALEMVDDNFRHRPGLPGGLDMDGFLRPASAKDMNAPSTSGRGAEGHAARRHRNKLVPLYTNNVCRTYFKISTHKEYVPVIRKLLKRDPLLTFALQKALRYLKAGEQKGVSHVTPDPSGQTSSLYGMRITPCVWSESGSLQAALLVEHNVPYNPAEVMPRLMRDYAVLSHVPAILTLIDFQGKVLYQNASSLAYMGDLLSVKYDNKLSEGLLNVLFMYDLHNLEQMLDDVLNGQEWQGVVQVPHSLRRYLAHNHAMETIIDVNGSFTAQGRAASAMAGPSGQDRLSTLDDELEVEFQIGNSFTTRGLVGKHRKQHPKNQGASFLVNKPGPGARASGPPGMGQSELAVTERNGSGENSGGTGNGTDDSFTFNNGYPEPFSHPSVSVPAELGAANMQQRKFMTLLDKAAQQQRGPRYSEAVVDDYDEGGHLETVEETLQDDMYDEGQECYHEIHAIPLLDPVLDKQVIMLVQTDVTPRVELENKLADLTDAQLSMLEQLFPRHIIEYMLARVPSRVSRNLRDLANTHEQVMVLFCDVVGFTSMSKEVEPSQVMHFLNELYEVFDDLVDEYGMYKLDIVGDCYIVVAGLIKEDQDGFVCVDEMDEDQITSNAVRIMQFAKAMLRESQPVLMPHNSEPVSLRIGIHTGPLVSGLVGAKMPKFTLFGDTMNTSSRMESTCQAGCIHVSDAFAKLLPHEDWESTGGVQVKGKGLMETFLWVPNNKRQELLELDPEAAVRGLRKSLTITSFTSTKSRATIKSSSTRSRRHSVDSDERSPSSNPLMTILTNIRGEDDEGSGEGGSLVRPKSARWGPNRSRDQRMSMSNTLHDSDHDSKRLSDRGTPLSRQQSEGGASFEKRSSKRYSESQQRRSQSRRPSDHYSVSRRQSLNESRRTSEVGGGRGRNHRISSGSEMSVHMGSGHDEYVRS